MKFRSSPPCQVSSQPPLLLLIRVLILALGTLLVLAPLEATAQGSADLRGLAVNWVRGRYASPLLCEIDGEPVRGLRRVLAMPSRANPTLPTGRLVFVEMDAPDARRQLQRRFSRNRLFPHRRLFPIVPAPITGGPHLHAPTYSPFCCH